MGIFSKQQPALPKPKSQIQEALWLLIKHRSGLTRKDFMDAAYIMNAPEAIRVLRDYGVPIETESIARTNKFGRAITYGRYKILPDSLAYAEGIYKSMCNGGQ